MNLIAFIYFFLMLMKYCYSKLSDQCMKSNSFWNSVKYPYNDIIKTLRPQSTVYNCPFSLSHNCCSSDMIQDMALISELKLKEFADVKLESILRMFSNDSYDLINIFLKDLDMTKNDLHQLFSTTYGYNYKMHKEFFFTWFDKLKLYMRGQLQDIGQLVDNFFNEMSEKIVQILIAPNSVAATIKCHTARLIESKPYQDTDVLLKKKILRSYPPARLLVNSIGVGRDVFNELINNISPSPSCINPFNTLFHCMLCEGLTLRPCSNQCNNICFGSFKSSDIKRLDKAFTKYIKTIIQLAGKLDNPFNFPEVNSKMTVQISTAIMNIQTMYPNIKEQIKARCKSGGDGSSGQVTRKRRQASKEFYRWQNAITNPKKPSWDQASTIDTNDDSSDKKDFNTYKSKPNDVLTPFVRQLKQKYKSLENYFRNQKSDLCSSISITNPSLDCWNGTAVDKNSAIDPEKDTRMKNIDKIESLVVKSALSQLNDITKRIQSYLSDGNVDPESMTVQDYKLYVSKKVDKPIDITPEIKLSPKIEGSGDSDLNKFPQLNAKPKKSKEASEISPVSPQPPDKGSWEFPTLTDGSGKGDNENVDEATKIKVPLSKKPDLITINTTADSTVLSQNRVALTTSKLSTVASIGDSDDEDLNPDSQEKVPKISSSKVPIIQPEGSGKQPLNPDWIPNLPVTVQSITTTQSLGTIIDGSGDEFKPKPIVPEPDPGFPVLPDSQKPPGSTPTIFMGKPETNPDEESVPVDGSGKSTQTSIQSPLLPLEPPPALPQQPNTVTQSTNQSSVAVSPETYPGKVPSEVWLPSLEAVKNQQKHGRKTTPPGSANDISRNNRMKMIFLQAMLSLFFRWIVNRDCI